jgi:lysophospholipid acyltransferase
MWSLILQSFESVPVEQLSFLTCLLFSLGLSQIYWKFLLPLPDQRTLKLSYMAVWGHVFVGCVLVFGDADFAVRKLGWLDVRSYLSIRSWNWQPWVHIYMPVLLTYTVTWCYLQCRWMPQLVFIALLAHLTLLHYWRFVHDYGKYTLNYVTVVMVNVMRLSTFAFDLHDAHVLQQAKKGDAQEEDSKEERLRERRLGRVRFPSLLEFTAYTFLFAGVLTGPLVCFPEFQSFLDGTYFLESASSKSKVKAAILPKEALKARRRYLAKLFARTLLILALYFWALPHFRLDYLLTADFARLGWLWRCLYLHGHTIFFRMRYYVAWGLAEASCVLIGLGFRPLTDVPSDPPKSQQSPPTEHGPRVMAPRRYRWDRLEMINIRRIELSSNFRDALATWHKPTHDWLYDYVYRRFGAAVRKDGRLGFRANLVTKLASAWWHGVYPGYYIVFCTAALYTYASKLVYKRWPFSWPGQRIIGAILHHLVLDYFVLTFELLSWQDSLQFLKAQHFWGHLALFLVVLLAPLVPAAKSHHHGRLIDGQEKIELPETPRDQQPLMARRRRVA